MLPLWRWYLFRCDHMRHTCHLLVTLFLANFAGCSMGTRSSLCRHIRGILQRGRTKTSLFSPLRCHMPRCTAAWSSVGIGGAVFRRYIIWPKPFACKRTHSGGSCKCIIRFLQAIGLSLQTCLTESYDFRNFVSLWLNYAPFAVITLHPEQYIPDDVLIQLILLMMSTGLLETCREVQ
jgi:hypothetical protein